jgi:hypothetical protein
MNSNQLRGVQRLVETAVHEGSRAVERVQKETARRVFWVLEKVPVVAPVSRVVELALDASVSLSHQGVRTVNAAVHRAVDMATGAPESDDP